MSTWHQRFNYERISICLKSGLTSMYASDFTGLCICFLVSTVFFTCLTETCLAWSFESLTEGPLCSVTCFYMPKGWVIYHKIFNLTCFWPHLYLRNAFLYLYRITQWHVKPIRSKKSKPSRTSTLWSMVSALTMSFLIISDRITTDYASRRKSFCTMVFRNTTVPS